MVKAMGPFGYSQAPSWLPGLSVPRTDVPPEPTLVGPVKRYLYLCQVNVDLIRVEGRHMPVVVTIRLYGYKDSNMLNKEK